MSHPIRIDVVVCTYDNAASLHRTLESLECQRGDEDADWGVLVVDNNSSDATAEVVERHRAAGTLRLRSVREPEQGLTPARRRGVRETDGDWIAFVDDDCLLAVDWIAQLAAAARARPDAGALGGQVVLAWDGEPPEHASRYGWAYAQQLHGSEPRTVDCLVGAGLVLRRGALAETGWTERPLLADRIGHQLVSGGDVELALRVGARHPLWYDPRLRLQHVIPVRRAAPQHLASLAYGLGSGKLLADTMVWGGGYGRWVARALRESTTYARDVAVAVRHRRRVDAAVTSAFLRGWLAGIWRLLRMDRSERADLLGCARPLSSG